MKPKTSAFRPRHYRSILKAFQRHPKHRSRKSVRPLLDTMWQKFFSSSTGYLDHGQIQGLADKIADDFQAYQGNVNDTPVAYLTRICKSVAMDARELNETMKQNKRDKYDQMMSRGIQISSIAT